LALLRNAPQTHQTGSRQGAYIRWKQAPFNASLGFKEIKGMKGCYSVRIGLHYRALGRKDGDTVKWAWIGTHAEYDTLIKQR